MSDSPAANGPRQLVRELVDEHFADADSDAREADDTAIATLGDEDAVDAFYDALESRTGGSLFLSDREEKVRTIGGAIAWADETRREQLGKNWKDAITPLQQKLMGGSWALGMVLIGLSLVLKPKGAPMNQPLFGLGMFIAAQLKWGVAGVYEWLAKNRPSLVERMGHAKLFWFVLIGAYLLSFIEIGLLFAILGIGT
ncbi:MAG: hypothetical protein AB7K09_18710 [Planctomycetota bacterium]